MNADYVTTPDYVVKRKTSFSDVGNSGYLKDEGTKDGLKNFSSLFFAAMIAANIAACPKQTFKTRWLQQNEKTTIGQVDFSSQVSSEQSVYGNLEKPTVLSARLQKEFGFKTAQWAAVLDVERKTLYNWIKRPETSLQQRVLKRLNVMNEFLCEIDSEHARYISKLAFGRYLDKRFADVLMRKPMQFIELVEEYNRLYAVFDGHYKRDKHREKVS